MKRRMRKKLKVDEFQELGFEIDFALAPEVSEDDLNALLDRFIEEALVANELVFCGGFGSTGRGFVSAWVGSVGEAERTKVGDWLEAAPEFTDVSVGPLIDAWHG